MSDKASAGQKKIVRVVANVLLGISFLVFAGLALQSFLLGDTREATLKGILAAVMAVMLMLPTKKSK